MKTFKEYLKEFRGEYYRFLSDETAISSEELKIVYDWIKDNSDSEGRITYTKTEGKEYDKVMKLITKWKLGQTSWTEILRYIKDKIDILKHDAKKHGELDLVDTL